MPSVDPFAAIVTSAGGGSSGLVASSAGTNTRTAAGLFAALIGVTAGASDAARPAAVPAVSSIAATTRRASTAAGAGGTPVAPAATVTEEVDPIAPRTDAAFAPTAGNGAIEAASTSDGATTEDTADDIVVDLADVLATIAPAAGPVVTFLTTPASPASLGAAPQTGSHTSDPAAGVDAPTADAGAAPSVAATAATVASTAATATGDTGVAPSPNAITTPPPTPTTTATTTPAPTGVAASVPGNAASALAARRAETAAEAASAATGTIGAAVSTTDPRLPPAIATVLAAAGASGATAETRARFTATGPASRAAATTTSTATAATTTSTAATAPTTSTAAATVTATGDSVVADPASTGVTTVSGEAARPAQDGGAIPSSDPARSAAAPSQAATATSTAATRAAPVATDAPVDPAASAGDEAVAVRDRTAKTSAPATESAERTDAADATASAAEPPAPPLGADGGRERPLAMAPVGEAGRSEATSEADRAVSLPQIAEAIAERSRSGHSRFDIRLSPAELGGVDVRIEVRSSGEVRAHLVVERTETLDLMLRDQRQLERSLTDAGLDVSSSGLQFSLKEQASGWGDQGRRTYEELADRGAVASAPTDEESETASIAAFARRPARAGGIDLRV